jgi:hypothetical protein
MKKLIVLTCLLLVAALTIYAQQSPKLHQGVAVDFIQAESGEEARGHFVTGLDSKQSCTIIYASDGRTALAGNNEDWTNPFPIIWFLPAEDGKFGRMYVGFDC